MENALFFMQKAYQCEVYFLYFSLEIHRKYTRYFTWMKHLWFLLYTAQSARYINCKMYFILTLKIRNIFSLLHKSWHRFNIKLELLWNTRLELILHFFIMLRNNNKHNFIMKQTSKNINRQVSSPLLYMIVKRKVDEYYATWTSTWWIMLHDILNPAITSSLCYIYKASGPTQIYWNEL